MRRTFRLALALPLVFSAAFFLVACTRHHDTNSNSREPRWLRWSIATLPSSLPLKEPCRQRSCWPVSSMRSAGLVQLHAEREVASVQPMWAAAWEWATPTRLVFHLRGDAKWSDGQNMIASDFVSAWVSLLKSGARDAALLAPVVHALDFAAGRASLTQLGCKAIDARTLEVQLTEVNPLFVATFAHPSLAPWRGPQLSSGPFLPARAVRSGTWRFSRNSFFPQPASFEGVEISVEPSAENRLARFHENAFDLADDIADPIAERLANGPLLQVARAGFHWVLAFHTGKRPFSERAMRMAFAAAVAREESGTLLGHRDWVAAGFGWLDPGNESRRGPAFNLAAAKSAMTPDSRMLESNTARVAPRLTLSWEARSGARDLAENLQAQWQKNLGSAVELAESEGSLATLQLLAIDDDPLTPWNTVTRFALGRAPGGWRNPHLDEAAALAPRSPDVPTLQDTLERGERILADEAVVAVPLLTKGRVVLRRPRLRELSQSPFGYWDFSRAILD